MSYQVFARKWRPQKFSDLVGQDHVVTTLRNALQADRLPHAIVFSGPRGTGKTSTARILAKSLTCPNAIDFVPCNECQVCQDINAGRSVDVLEIDGASHNGVDAIRELRDNAHFLPTSGKYRIQIIDEVHMLSNSAFNALLKTLEEPPSHMIFILATTEIHKLPMTILSRCQKFEFRRISIRSIVDKLRQICTSENVTFEDEALWLIAQQGDGSMRDSESLLDQVATFSNRNLSVEAVIENLGIYSKEDVRTALEALVHRSSETILRLLKKIHRSQREPIVFAKELMHGIRNLLMVKIVGPQATTLIEAPDSELRFLETLAHQIGEEDLHLLFDMTLKGANDLGQSLEPELVLDMLLLRLVHAPFIKDLKEILNFNETLRESRTESRAVESTAAAALAHRPLKNYAATGAAAMLPTVHSGVSSSPGLTSAAKPSHEKWFDLVHEVKKRDALLSAKLEPLVLTSEANKVLDLQAPATLSFVVDQLQTADIQTKLKTFIEQFFGPGYAFQVTLQKEAKEKGKAAAGSSTHSGVSVQGMKKEQAKKGEEELLAKMAQNPQLKKASSLFSGELKIKEIKQESRK